MATLNVLLTTDYSTDLLNNISRIRFINFAPATATFDASQFDDVAIRDDVLLVGSTSQNLIEVNGGSIDASSWQFLGWDYPSDLITLTGSAAADTITGSSRADTIVGRNGADVLSGLGGDDTIRGGRGVDIISGGLGADTLIGGKQADEFHYAAAEEIETGESLDGGDSANDAIVLDGQGVEFDLTDATISNIEKLRFTNGATVYVSDSQIGSTSALLTVEGSGGQDRLVVRALASFADLSAIVISNWSVGPDVPVDQRDSISIYGTVFDDTLIGSSYDETIVTYGGNDNVAAGGGNDSVTVMGGLVTVDCSEGDDKVSCLGLDSGSLLDGGAGYDVLLTTKTGGQESMDIDFTTSTVIGFERLVLTGPIVTGGPLSVHLTSDQIGYRAIDEVAANTDEVTLTVEGQIIDLTYVDFILNNPSADVVTVLTGTAGTDVLFGSTLADTITGGAELDAMAGYQGRDTFIYNGKDDLVAGEYVDGGNQRDTLELHGAFNDTYLFNHATLNSIEVLSMMDNPMVVGFDAAQIEMFSEINGYDFAQKILIFDATDLDLSALSFPVWDQASNLLIINGTISADMIVGSLAVDQISADEGDDVIDGGGGNDRIYGGYGRDEMTGGAGNDLFRYGYLDETPTGEGRDRINDFTQGEDHIDLSFLYYYNFAFLEDQSFSATGAAEINYVQSGTNTIVQLDGDGDGVAESKIALTGLFALTVDDFLL